MREMHLGKMVTNPNPKCRVCGQYVVSRESLTGEWLFVCPNCEAKYERVIEGEE